MKQLGGGNYRLKLNDVDFNGTDSDDICTNLEFGIYIFKCKKDNLL